MEIKEIGLRGGVPSAPLPLGSANGAVTSEINKQNT